MPKKPEKKSESSFDKKVKTRRNWSILAGGLPVLVGLVLLAVAAFRFWTVERGIGLVAPACALLAAGVASIVATLAVISWAEQRQRDREVKLYEHREKIYEAITQFMVARFMDEGYNAAIDGQLRAAVALWGSAGSISALAGWQEGLTKIIEDNEEQMKKVGSPSTTRRMLSEQEQHTALRLFGQAVNAMRLDLAPEDTEEVPTSVLLRSVFNQKIPDDFNLVSKP
ncbi:hypothetical protein [Glutamicibacter sp. MCAF14]|uniref:hypothetical protein n=1 Tax=Glutamicibacter sp. MCAF14 TaxID=3233043 RepID=UPI003F901E0F